MYSKSAATITDLLNSAQTLFLRKNYADLTMEDVAAEAGVTRGAIYQHSGSKDSLYMANVEVILTPYAERIFDNQNEILDFVIHLFLMEVWFIISKIGLPLFRAKKQVRHTRISCLRLSPLPSILCVCFNKKKILYNSFNWRNTLYINYF